MARFAAALLLPLAAGSDSGPTLGSTSAAELRLACRAELEAPDSNSPWCRTYLLGFLEATAAAGDLVIGHVPADRKPTWEERAARTRLGSRIHHERPSRPPLFCMPDPLPIAALTARIVEAPTTIERVDQQRAAELLRAVLQQHYACP